MRETLGFFKLCVSHLGNWLWEPNLLTGRFTWRNPESDGAVWQGLSFPSQQHYVEAEIIHIVEVSFPETNGITSHQSVIHLNNILSPAAHRISGYTSPLTCSQIWTSSLLSLYRLINHHPAVRKRGIIHISFGFLYFAQTATKALPPTT